MCGIRWDPSFRFKGKFTQKLNLSNYLLTSISMKRQVKVSSWQNFSAVSQKKHIPLYYSSRWGLHFFLINYSFNTATYQFGDCWLNKKEDMEQVTLQKTDQRHFSVTSFLDFLRKKNVWNQFRLFVLNKSDNAKVVLFWATLY